MKARTSASPNLYALLFALACLCTGIVLVQALGWLLADHLKGLVVDFVGSALSALVGLGAHS
ncbi:hypothetical protein D3C77_763960 [compost metagenome]